MNTTIPHVTITDITGGLFEPITVEKDENMCASLDNDFLAGVGDEYTYHALGKPIAVYLKQTTET